MIVSAWALGVEMPPPQSRPDKERNLGSAMNWTHIIILAIGTPALGLFAWAGLAATGTVDGFLPWSLSLAKIATAGSSRSSCAYHVSLSRGAHWSGASSS